MTELPPGYTVEETRFGLWALCNDGKKLSFSGTEEAARRAVLFQPEFFDGRVTIVNTSSHVDL